jgi:hypothetical protein
LRQLTLYFEKFYLKRTKTAINLKSQEKTGVPPEFVPIKCRRVELQGGAPFFGLPGMARKGAPSLQRVKDKVRFHPNIDVYVLVTSISDHASYEKTIFKDTD